MADTFTNLLIHFVFSTKNRIPFLQEPLQERTHEYIGGIVREERGIPLEIGGMPDHVHVLARIRPDRSVAEMTRTMKSASSKWVHQTFPASASFAWQAGYAAFSVSESQAGAVRRYIRNQAAHHARLSFKEELISLLRKNRVEFDERYLWD